jgi:TRAP-type C4-dicarboxylate transport system permease small subunit
MKPLSIALIYISQLMCAVAVTALTVMMLLTIADVALRTFSSPIPGTYELVGILGAIVIGFSLPYTTVKKGHVVMDFLTEKLPRPVRSFLYIVTRILAIAFFVIAAWNLCRLGADYSKAGEFTLTLKLPLYPIPYGIAFCCFVQCLILLGQMVGLKQGTDK